MSNFKNGAQVKLHVREPSLLCSLALRGAPLLRSWQSSCFRRQKNPHPRPFTSASADFSSGIVLLVASSTSSPRPFATKGPAQQNNGTGDKFSRLKRVNKDRKGLCSWMTPFLQFFFLFFFSFLLDCSAIRMLFLLRALHGWIAACYLQLGLTLPLCCGY